MPNKALLVYYTTVFALAASVWCMVTVLRCAMTDQFFCVLQFCLPHSRLRMLCLNSLGHQVHINFELSCEITSRGNSFLLVRAKHHRIMGFSYYAGAQSISIVYAKQHTTCVLYCRIRLGSIGVMYGHCIEMCNEPGQSIALYYAHICRLYHTMMVKVNLWLFGGEGGVHVPLVFSAGCVPVMILHKILLTPSHVMARCEYWCYEDCTVACSKCHLGAVHTKFIAHALQWFYVC